MYFKRITSLFIAIPLYCTALSTFAHIFSPDCPFSDVFSSPTKAAKGLTQAFNLYFKGINDEQWDSRPLIDPVIAKQYLGYDPALEYIYEKNNPNKTTTLYLHGWGDTKNSARILKKFCKVVDNNIVTFNFADARPVLGKLNQSNFGQLSDVLSALYAAHCAIKELNLKALDLFGISRGGATIINMLALLNDPELFVQYKETLDKIGIDQTARKEILNAIQNGTIILNIPLRSMKHTPVPQFLARNITQYDPHGWEALEMVKHLNGLKLTMLVHFQHGDAIVSNKGEDEFFFHLAKNNPNSTYLVMGNDGGHMHTHTALSKTVGEFKSLDKKNIHVIRQESDTIKDGILIQFMTPTFEQIKKALHTYHEQEYKKSFFGRIKNIWNT
jgi:hypothetical protein